MKVPSIEIAEEMLKEAEIMNPGAWADHNRVAGICAKTIARVCGDINEDVAYVMGLLHDIGRREGVTDMHHILSGYRYMVSQGYEDSARICLTHSFPYKDVRAYNGKNDCTEEETAFIQSFLDKTDYDNYDKLIQLCDALSFPTGPVYMEKRLVDVVLRRGFNELTVPKWKVFLDIKKYFDEKAGMDIYKLLGI